MANPFTSTTVLLAEDFVRSYSKETIQSKLSKLRLVTGIEFSKANKSYAVTGSWDQVDAAFAVLSHWHSNSDHEPDFENALDARLVDLCDCDLLNTLKNLKLKRQNESESRDVVLSTSKGAEQNEACEIQETVKSLKREYESLCEKSKTKQRKGTKVKKRDAANKAKKQYSLTNKHVTHPYFTALKDRKEDKSNFHTVPCTENSLENNCTDINGDLTIELENDAENDKSAQTLRAQSPFTDDQRFRTKDSKLGETERNGSPVKKKLLEQKSKLVQDLLEPSQNSSVLCNKSSGKEFQSHASSKPITITKTKVSKIMATNKPKKPGEEGYWSRVKRTDHHQKYECMQCNAVLKSRKRYLEHLRRIHIREYQCGVCEKRFGYPTDLNRHKCPGNDDSQAEHSVEVKTKIPEPTIEIPCPECSYSASSKKKLHGHIQRNHRLDFSCDQCEKKFGFLRDLNRHKQTLHSNRMYVCDQCSKVYKNKQVFESHLKTHELGYVKPNFTCDHCEKSFTTKYSKAAHMKTAHLGLNNVYLCQICGKEFKQRSSYKQHCNAHNGIKPYQCEICNKAFVYHKSLQEHKFMHDNVRRFPCTKCDKAFRQRTTLHIHMKIHKTVKDHICSVCGRGFSQKQALERHERTHTGVRPYTCVLCKKSFGDTSTIRRHMISIHHKLETNWREDTISAVKKKSDYYVLGGSGHNRTFKAKSASPKKAVVLPENSGVVSLSSKTQVEPSLIVLNPVQTNMQDSKGNYILSGSPTAGGQNMPVIQTLQPGTVYAISTSQSQQVPSPNQSAIASAGVPVQNGHSQVHDFSTMTLLATKLPQSSVEKSGEEHVQQQVQGPTQTVLQTATLVPLTAISECLKLAPALASPVQVSADSTLSQAIASLWGFISYPSQQTAGNLTQYQPPQN